MLCEHVTLTPQKQTNKKHIHTTKQTNNETKSATAQAPASAAVMLLSAVPAASAGPAAESTTAMLKGPRTADEENVNDDEFGLNDDYNEEFRPEERDNY